MLVSDQLDVSAALPSGKNTDTHWTGGWVGLRGELNVMEKRKSFGPTWIRTPDCSSRRLIATPTTLTRLHLLFIYLFMIHLTMLSVARTT
jgi:hypothetical protein